MTTRISMLAIDLAKGSVQVCAGGGPDGADLYNRDLSRTRLATRLSEQPACVGAMEACATSHHWGRVAQRHSRELRFVPAAYVKPCEKRQKSDRADAEAIAGAALRQRSSRSAPADQTIRWIVRRRGTRGVAEARLRRDAWPGATTEVHGWQVHVGIGRAGMGQTDIPRLLIVDASRQGRASRAMSVTRLVVRRSGSSKRWLAALVERKPRMVAAVALVNKMARMIWATTTKQEDYPMACPSSRDREEDTAWPQGRRPGRRHGMAARPG